MFKDTSKFCNWIKTKYKLIYINEPVYIKLEDFINHESDYSNIQKYTFNTISNLYDIEQHGNIK